MWRGDDERTKASGVQLKTEAETPEILVVDDERDVADLYAMWLGEEYETSVAYDGAQALEDADESVDIVLLDRQMPGLSGDEVLGRVRERGLDCRVVMVTAVDPDVDIVDMPFDDYLTKPVTGADLRETVEAMMRRDAYDDRLQAYFAALSKQATLESEMNPKAREESGAYAKITARVERLADEVDHLSENVDNFESLFSDLTGSD
ncbi:response regulator [Halomicrobium sp. HM KBTZ05]|uniref:response regulator n=1 Tax=Halomicrobium sp. HM KBTZ05 TaxID=3242663 RepID=UPI003557AB4C